MTLADLMRALMRRWYLVLLVMSAALVLAFLATRSEPMYHARTEVVFLAPSSARYPNELVTSSESLILTAGAVSERINGAGRRLDFGASTVNPVGSPDTGEDTWITLLDTGNQWVPAFEHQVLVIDATGTTPERAEARIAEAADLVRTELIALEDEQGVDEINRIGLRLSPETPQITVIDGSSARAAGMTLFLGLLASIAIVVVLEVRGSKAQDEAAKTRLTRHRRRRVRRRRGPAAPL
jgi:hypothetical protein